MCMEEEETFLTQVLPKLPNYIILLDVFLNLNILHSTVTGTYIKFHYIQNNLQAQHMVIH